MPKIPQAVRPLVGGIRMLAAAAARLGHGPFSSLADGWMLPFVAAGPLTWPVHLANVEHSLGTMHTRLSAAVGAPVLRPRPHTATIHSSKVEDLVE